MRLTGSRWTLISFTPWILYWCTSAVDEVCGLALGLTAALAAYLVGLRTRASNIINTASLAFFTLGLASLLVGLEVVASYGSFLSYAALFGASLYSILRREPFTLKLARMDYPEPYWSDPKFLKVNYALTCMWTSIFLACTILSLTGRPLSLASYLLVITGAAVSAFSPPLLVRMYLEREFRGYPDWEPEGRQVVIVGAGIGGLACAALLAKNGYKVTVLEQHYKVGGYCTSFSRRGFTFDGGVESISGLWDRGAIRLLLDELGVDWREVFVRVREAYILEGEFIDIPGKIEEFIEELARRFPGEAEGIKEFFNDVERVVEEVYSSGGEFGVPLPPPLIYRVLGFKKLFDFPKRFPHMMSWMNLTYKQVLDRYFRDEKLKRLLSLLTAYLGTVPEEAPAISMAVILGYYLFGGYYPKGGSQAYADLLARIIRENGGEILLNHKVEKVIVEEGRVKGVVANGRVFEASIVVFAANAKQLLEVVEDLPEDFARHIEGLKPSVTAFIAYLGLDLDLSSYPPLIKDIDQGIGLVIASNLDGRLAPKGCSTLSIIVLLPQEMYDYFSVDNPTYSERKKRYTEDLVEKAERIIPELRKHIVVIDAATPHTFEKYTLNHRGAIYAFDQSVNAPPRPYFKTPVRGLYLAGASTFPGAGVEAVTISGIIAAHDIMGWGRSILKKDSC